MKEDCKNIKKNIELMVISEKTKIKALTNLVLSYYKANQLKKVNAASENLYLEIEKNKDNLNIVENIIFSAKERLVQLKIWKLMYKSALEDIMKLEEEFPKKTEILALQSQLYSYKGEFTKVIEKNDKILSLDKASFNALL